MNGMNGMNGMNAMMGNANANTNGMDVFRNLAQYSNNNNNILI
jgi:hypothetical protein